MISAVSAENVDLNIVSGTSGNGTYIIECTPTDFTASTFNWDFGDTVIVPGITGLVQHSYVTDGNYTVMCTGIGSSVNATASLAVSVNMAGVNQTNDTNETNSTNVTNNETTANQTNVTAAPQNVVMVMKHLCNANILDRTDFAALEAGKDPVAALANTVLNCPTTGLPGDEPSPAAVASGRIVFDFMVTGSNGTSRNLESADFSNHQVCESDINKDVDGNGNISNSTCLDISHYHYENISGGHVTVVENMPPAGYKFGTLRFTPTELAPNNDAASLVSLGEEGNGTIALNTTGDTDGEIMLHVYNFVVGNQANASNNETNETNTTNQTGAYLTIKSYYPQSGAYIFECNTPGMAPSMYSWIYGDGQKNINISNQNVFHTYEENGDYKVQCSASDGQSTTHASRSISISDIPYVNSCSAMQNLAATCAGGTITQQDLGKSCRTIICSGNGAEMTVLACDKPSADNPLYFDMYKQSATGSNLTICLGDTCIHRNGFARSGLQACFSGETNNSVNHTNTTGNNTNTTANNTGNQNMTDSVSLSVASGFPQNASYVFVCNATNFTATSHNFDFGDGQQQWNVGADNVYHTYTANGNYSVQCMATDGVMQGNTSLAIEVGGSIAIPNNTGNQTNETGNSTGNVTNVTTIVTTIVSLHGAQEVPPNNSTGAGSATATLNGTMMSVTGYFSNLEGNVTDAHVHLALAGVIGPVVIPLIIVADSGNHSGNFSAEATVNSTVMEAFMDNSLYVNVHSDIYPAGEIRGQLVT